ncbi:hypothetical protein PG994_002285 [Apiospora phragmitis]|uniref:Protein kinase domain-containing protein n=1 Tax=Apiospora phragmitis TaxID=2905665 RepID=A0ABR1WVX6_9PEZI
MVFVRELRRYHLISHPDLWMMRVTFGRIVMSTAVSRKYRQAGVFLPHFRTTGKPKTDENTVPGGVAEKGFLFVKELVPGGNLNIVQSVETGKLYVNKILERGINQRGMRENFVTRLPPELRFSTIHKERANVMPTLSNASCFLIKRVMTLDSATQYKKCHPQIIFTNQTPLGNRYANGGTIENLIKKYNAERKAVPEHFIWHVAVELGEALAGLAAHLPPRPAGEQRLLHYEAPYRGGHLAGRGKVQNVFPTVMVGDFGIAARDGDPVADLQPSVLLDFDEATIAAHPAIRQLNDWEDIYAYSVILRSMFQANIHENAYTQNYDQVTPERFTAREANRHDLPAGQQRHFSAMLEAWLRQFEWPDMRNNGIETTVTDANWFQVNNWTHQPNLAHLLDNMLPNARRELERHRANMGRDYRSDVNVSWTKQVELSARPTSTPTSKTRRRRGRTAAAGGPGAAVYGVGDAHAGRDRPED